MIHQACSSTCIRGLYDIDRASKPTLTWDWNIFSPCLVWHRQWERTCHCLAYDSQTPVELACAKIPGAHQRLSAIRSSIQGAPGMMTIPSKRVPQDMILHLQQSTV